MKFWISCCLRRIGYIFISQKNTPALSSQRYLVIFSGDSEFFAFSAMFRAIRADFNFDNSGDNWFSDEHFWASLIHSWTLLASDKQIKTWIQPSRCFFHNWCWKDEPLKILKSLLKINFWKFLNVWFFGNLSPFNSKWESNLFLQQKTMKILKLTLQIREKCHRSYLRCFHRAFWRTCEVSAPAMFMAGSVGISLIQSWNSLFQKGRWENHLFSELSQDWSEFIIVYSRKRISISNFVSYPNPWERSNV